MAALLLTHFLATLCICVCVRVCVCVCVRATETLGASLKCWKMKSFCQALCCCNDSICCDCVFSLLHVRSKVCLQSGKETSRRRRRRERGRKQRKQERVKEAAYAFCFAAKIKHAIPMQKGNFFSQLFRWDE